MCTECIAALYTNQTSQYVAAKLAVLSIWEPFQHYGSYGLIFQDSRHAQATHLRLYDDAPVRWRQLRGLFKLTLKNLSEEVEIEIEKNKTSYIVEKPCLTLELLGLQGRLGRRTS